jgi:integrase
MSRGRKGSTLHPGVSIFKRTSRHGAVSWVARWTDPETERPRTATLDEADAVNKTARTEWGKGKVKELDNERIRVQLESEEAARVAEEIAEERRRGYDRFARASPTAARDRWIAKIEEQGRSKGRPKVRTIASYRRSAAWFVRWAEGAGVEAVEDLVPLDLGKIHHALETQPRAHVREGEPETISAASANKIMREVKVLLNGLRKMRMLRHIHRDDIADMLSAIPATRPTPTPLSVTDCRRVLAACLRHDADPLNAGREVGPLVATAMMTGLRASEVRCLAWSEVDLDATDRTRTRPRTGLIRLSAEETKTHRGRVIPLHIMPGLRTLLVAWRLRGPVGGFCFGGEEPLRGPQISFILRKLTTRYKAPAFTWQRLRQTCATSLHTSAVFGRDANAKDRACEMLGHSRAVAGVHYVEAASTTPATVDTLEDVIGVTDLLAMIARGPAAVRAERLAG